MILFADYGTSCTSNGGTGPLASSVCGVIYIDVNGAKEPNTWGKDVYQFWVTKTGVYPCGSNGDAMTCTTSGAGTGCAATVLMNQ